MPNHFIRDRIIIKTRHKILLIGKSSYLGWNYDDQHDPKGIGSSPFQM